MLPKQKQIAKPDTTDEYVLMFATWLMCESAEKKIIYGGKITLQEQQAFK